MISGVTLLQGDVRMSGIGDQFQRETQYEPDRMPRHQLVWEAKPDVYKDYPEATKIELPSFEPSRAMSLDQTLKQRKRSPERDLF